MNQNLQPTSLQTTQTTGQAANNPAATPEQVLRFWLKDGLENDWPSVDIKALKKLWFGGGKTLDDSITARFGNQVVAAVQGGLPDWEAGPLDRLALILLLDQFSRNVFRGSRRAFDGDARAQQLVMCTVDAHEDQMLPIVGRLFLYMPLMHAENLALQDECLRRFSMLHDTVPPDIKPMLGDQLDFAAQHRDIIAQFGRFPHRNAALGRASTEAEAEFLVSGKRFGQ